MRAVQPVEDKTAVGITPGSSALYSVGSAQLSQIGRGVLETVAGIVVGYSDWRIDVKGYTDSQRIAGALVKSTRVTGNCRSHVQRQRSGSSSPARVSQPTSCLWEVVVSFDRRPVMKRLQVGRVIGASS